MSNKDLRKPSNFAEVCKVAASVAMVNCLKAGSLSKEGGYFKTWKKRLFVLTKDALYYFKNHKEQEAKGFVPLAEATSCAISQPDSKKGVIFTVETPHRDFKIAASTQEVAAEWVARIQDVIQHHRGKGGPSDGDGAVSGAAGSSASSSSPPAQKTSPAPAPTNASMSGDAQNSPNGTPPFAAPVSAETAPAALRPAAVMRQEKLALEMRQDAARKESESEEEEEEEEEEEDEGFGKKDLQKGEGVEDEHVAAARKERMAAKVQKRLHRQELRAKAQGERHEALREALRVEEQRRQEQLEIRARELAAARERRKVKYLQIMQNGMELLKFNFESNSKPHKRFFKVSADGHSLEFGSKPSKLNRQYKLEDVKYLVYGPYSKVFHKRRNMFALASGRERCFSVVTSKRTLDVQAPSDEACEAWYLGLQFLVEKNIQHTNAVLQSMEFCHQHRILTYSQFLFKRVAEKLRAQKVEFSTAVLEAVCNATEGRDVSVNAELRAAFSTFFGNPHVEVDQEGFLRFVGELGGSLVQNNIFNMLWRECDVAGTGKLSFKECLSLMDALLNLNELGFTASLFNKFQKLDFRHEGKLTPDFFRHLLSAAFGQEPTVEEVEDFFDRFDKDGDGYISWDEFLYGSFKQPSKIRDRALSLSAPGMLDVALCFDAFDANHDGTVDRNEFDSFMSIMGVDVKKREEDLNTLWEEANYDGTGKLNLTQFLSLAESLFDVELLMQTARIRNIFLDYDANQDGSISRDEVRAIFADLQGSVMPEEVLDGFMHKMDADSDGRITWTEFLAGAIGNITAFDIFHNSPRHEKQLLAVFDAFDEDGNGALDLSEVVQLVKSLSVDFHGKQDRIIQWFESLDRDQDGFLSFLEFLRLARKVLSAEELNLVATLKRFFDETSEEGLGMVPLPDVPFVLRNFVASSPDASVDDFTLIRTFLERVEDTQGGVMWVDFLRVALEVLPQFKRVRQV